MDSDIWTTRAIKLSATLGWGAAMDTWGNQWNATLSALGLSDENAQEIIRSNYGVGRNDGGAQRWRAGRSKIAAVMIKARQSAIVMAAATALSLRR